MREPIVTASPEGHRWQVEYPCGGSAVITERDNGDAFGHFRWETERANGLPSREFRFDRAVNLERACRAAWAELRPEPAPTGDTLDALSDADSWETKAYTKALRNVLKRRTGRLWSVKVGQGTGYSWVSINSPPARQENYGMSADDESLLAATLNESMGGYVSIPPTPGYRLSYILRAAGLPDSATLAEHSWRDN
jgi:hypothetical protein